MTKIISDDLAKKVYQRMYYLSRKKKKMTGFIVTKGDYLITFN